MSPGSAVATACLALLSVWRFADGQPVWAAVFAGLALVHLAFALRRRDGSRNTPAADPSRPGWVRLAIANLVLAVAAVFWFPRSCSRHSGSTLRTGRDGGGEHARDPELRAARHGG
jgi:hypothetical protein